MKKIMLTSLFAGLFVSNVLATPAQLNVPFSHQAVPEEGLTFFYDTEGTKKIFCSADNFYKGYLFITVNGVEKEADIVYGAYDGTQFYFTSVGNDIPSLGISQFHVDQSGLIKMKDTHYVPHEAFVSCYYVPENQ